MTWAQPLKRVFNVDAETCRESSRAVTVIACIDDLAAIKTTGGSDVWPLNL